MIATRRQVLLSGTAALALAAAGPAAAASGRFEIERSEEEWRDLLSLEEYAVLREEATEYPWSSPLNDEHRPGIFACRGCELPLFDAETKFESGTGWPSFTAPLENAVGESTDYKLGYARTEIHCRRCGSHLGHVFDDGPPPTGLRYCMNGVALRFLPAG